MREKRSNNEYVLYPYKVKKNTSRAGYDVQCEAMGPKPDKQKWTKLIKGGNWLTNNIDY